MCVIRNGETEKRNVYNIKKDLEDIRRHTSIQPGGGAVCAGKDPVAGLSQQ